MAPVGDCKCTLCKSLDPIEGNIFGKKSLVFEKLDLYPINYEPEDGCSCENCADLVLYRKDPSLKKFSSQPYCRTKCQCGLCVRKREERATGWSNFVPYYPDFACLCFTCRNQRFDWQMSEIKRLRRNILKYRREIRDPGSYVGFYLSETSEKRQQRLDKLVRDSQICLKAAEENLWKKYGVVVTEADETEIAKEQEEERQAEYRRNFPHTCLRCVLDEDDKFTKSKSESADDDDKYRNAIGFGPKNTAEKSGFGVPPGWDK